MTTTAIFRNFKQEGATKNRFDRGSVLEIRNANLHHGDVRPFACPERLCECVGGLKTLHPLPDCECFGFTDCQSIVKGFCCDQYFSISNGSLVQSTGADLCGGGTGCLAGAPFNPTPPEVEVADCPMDDCDVGMVYYVITHKTLHGGLVVESAPSPPSVGVKANADKPDATVSWTAAPAGYCVVETCIYRTTTSFEDGLDAIPPANQEFVLVGCVPSGAAGTFTDDLTTHETGGPLTTYAPMAFPAPAGGLVDVARTLDGIAVASSCQVYISIPGQPQFTFDGVVDIEDEITHLRAIGNTLFVFTKGFHVKLGYRHTDGAMTIDKQVIQRKIPVCSCQSISVHGDRIYFAGNYGLYIWDIAGYGADIKPVLNSMLTPEQWKNLKPETLRGVATEFGYIFSTDAIDYSLLVEYGADAGGLPTGPTLMPIDYIKADAFGTNDKGDIIYRQCNHIYKWDWRRTRCPGDTDSFDLFDHVFRPPANDDCPCCPWTVKLYIDNEGKNRFSKMRVEFDERTGPVQAAFSLPRFGDRVDLCASMEVVKSRGFPIPGFCSDQTFCLELTGCSILHEVRLATSYQELTLNSNNQVEG